MSLVYECTHLRYINKAKLLGNGIIISPTWVDDAKKFFRMLVSARHQWLTPVILATQEAEIRRITVRSQHWQIVH
jgi:hypothetical protein